GTHDDQHGDHDRADERFAKRGGACQMMRHADRRAIGGVAGVVSGVAAGVGWTGSRCWRRRICTYGRLATLVTMSAMNTAGIASGSEAKFAWMSTIAMKGCRVAVQSASTLRSPVFGPPRRCPINRAQIANAAMATRVPFPTSWRNCGKKLTI